MAIEYLAGERLIGTAAERAAMTTGEGDINLTFSGNTEGGSTWNFGHVGSSVGTITGGQMVMNTSSQGISTWEISPTVAVTDSLVVDFDLERLSGDIYDHPMIAIRSDAAVHSDPSGNDVRATLCYWGNGGSGSDASQGKWSGGVGINAGDTSPVEHNFGAMIGSSVIQQFNTRFYARWILSATTTRKITMQIWVGSGAEAARDAGNTGHASNIHNAEESGAAISTDFLSANGTNPWRYLIIENKNGNTAHWSMNGIKVKFGTATMPTLTYPNLPNGAIFEESNTGKHYMWDGTSAWNVVV